MRDDDKTDLPGWLGLKRSPDFDKARWLGSALSVVVIVLFGMAVLVVFAVLGHALFGLGMDDVPRIGFGTGAVAVALIGAPFVIWRSVVAQKTVTLQEQGHITDRINTAVEGLGAEKTVNRIGRILKVKAADGHIRQEIKWVGGKLKEVEGDKIESEGEWQVFNESLPNLEVRIGAIYALERIAQDSDRDHVQIMEILCAYIRQNAPAPAEDDWPELEIYESEEDGPLEADWEDRRQTFRKKQDEKKETLKLREDIQTALTVIGRRSARQRRLEAGRGIEAVFPFDDPCPEYDGPDDYHDRDALKAYREKLTAWKVALETYNGYRLDLRDADLRGADLSRADLNGVLLTRTYLQSANLVAARLQGAGLIEARLQGASLVLARLQGAYLMDARLQGVNLSKARLQGTGLIKARLQAANLYAARLQGAVLRLALLQGGHLHAARLQGADLQGARLQGALLGFLWVTNDRTLAAARLQGANLWGVQLDAHTDLNEANLQGAAVRSVDFTDVLQITEHLQEMFGDASVILPGGHGPEHVSQPKHWPNFELDPWDFDDEWRKWQADPETYRPPDPPKREDTA